MTEAEKLLQETKSAVVAETQTEDICVIDSDMRIIDIPEQFKVLGVESDKDVRAMQFRVPKTYKGTDLSAFTISVNYQNARGMKDRYIVTDKKVSGDQIEFSWTVGKTATVYRGDTRFIVCMRLIGSDGVIKKEFNTTLATMTVLEGLEVDNPVIEQEEKDIIAQLLNRMDEVEAMATPEAMQGYVNTYLVAHPAEIDPELLDPKKCAPADVVGQLKEDLAELGNKILYEEYADLLHGKEPKENWYIDPSNGSGKTLAQFFSFTDIDVSNYIEQRIYPYTSIDNNAVLHSSRSVVFYNKDGSYIEGHGVSSNNPIAGIEVPNGAKTVSVCFNYDSDNNQPIKPQVYYLAINRENKNKLILKSDVSIDYEQIQNKPIIPTKMSELENDIVIDSVNDVQTIRKPTISFIFDDGLPSTSDLVSLFDSYGWKCGFAILANSNLSNIKDNFLSYQSKGYEILSHSTDGVAMQDGSLAIDDVETKMKKSKEILINNGFNITGWVTPSTWLNNKYFDNLCKYYEYGFGHLDTNQVVNHHVFWGNDIRQLERWSLQSKTLEQTKAEIDATINECGYLCFYAHAYPSTVNDNFTIENMKIIMDYIKKYIDNGKVQVLTPRCAINDYYRVRHSDLLNLYKQV